MSAPLRVAIFGESYLPYLSGVTVSTEALARGLGALGHQVLLVAPRPADGDELVGAGSPGPDPEYAWLPSYQAPAPAPHGYRMPWPVPSMALRRARDFAPDLVHAQSPFVSGLMARRLAQVLRVPLVFTHHTRFADYGHYLGPLAAAGGAVLRAYLREFWVGCRAVIAPGSELAAEIRAGLGGRSLPTVATIPTGIDVAMLQALEPARPAEHAAWPRDAIVVVSLGRLAAEKSVDLLLEAFAAAAASEPRLRLLLIGGGPAERELRDRASRPDLDGRVAFAGELPRQRALAMARGGDLFAFASRTETQGLVLAEALALGLPVVARAGPGVADTIRDGVDGRVIPSVGQIDDARRLGAALLELATDEELRSTMSAAAADGAERFDVGRRVREVASLYEDLLTPRTTGC